jgi:hypothetical protein
MRYSLLLVPLALIGVSGCASDEMAVSRQTTTTQATHVSSMGYLTPEQSSGLIILPGDTITPAQLRFLSEERTTSEQNRWRLASSSDPTGAEIAPLMARNLSH